MPHSRTSAPSRARTSNRRPGTDRPDHSRGQRQHQSGSRPNRGSNRAPGRQPARKHSIWDELPVQVVDTENLPAFAELGLPTALVDALDKAGMRTPFPIQAATIPSAVAGRDVLGRAATGSGKTLAFGLPVIAALADGRSAPTRPRALILVPTRELALQVHDAIAPLAAPNRVSVRVVAGGLPMGKQITALERGLDVVVATPGRLIDLIERGACDLSDVRVSVLDEADHMADLGFLPVVRRLLDLTPADGQRLLFSATLDGDVATLVENYLSDPAVYALSTAVASVDTMTHHLFRVTHEARFGVVSQIAARDGRTIAFVRTKHGADRLAKQLGRAGVAAGALHGGRTQAQRNKALAAFKDGSVPVLVATDVAARGIHVDDVSLVLHVDPPADPKDYLHRSGRTARAGEDGVVVVLTAPAEERATRKMLTAAGVQPDQYDVAPGDAVIADVTGGREPSGVPVAAPAPARPAGHRGAPHARRGGAPGQRHTDRPRGRRGQRP